MSGPPNPMRSEGNRGDAKRIGGTPYLFLLMPPFSLWLLPLQDTPQCLFKLSNKTVISQGSACPLMPSYPLDLFLGSPPGGKCFSLPLPGWVT